jgi:GNAT superfamily N-acetyltransferase
MSEVRSINHNDLEVIASILKSSLTFDPDLTTDLINFRIFQDPDFDPALSLAKTVDGNIVSLVCATNPKDHLGTTISSDVAWIKVFATDKEFRKRRFESQLFHQLFDILKTRGVTEVRFSDRGNWHFWPGVDLNYEAALDFLIEMGFTKDGEYVDYTYDMSHFFYPRRIQRQKQHLQKEGISFSFAGSSDQEEVLNWIEKYFGVFWKNESEFALTRSEPSVFIAREKTGDLLGFATINGVAPGRFGPMGVRTDQRKRGIGAVLLLEAFQALKDQDFQKATVHWTDHLYFYAQIPGLNGVRDYWIMRRSL